MVYMAIGVTGAPVRHGVKGCNDIHGYWCQRYYCIAALVYMVTGVKGAIVVPHCRDDYCMAPCWVNVIGMVLQWYTWLLVSKVLLYGT
jgi:hypothetical protein